MYASTAPPLGVQPQPYPYPYGDAAAVVVPGQVWGQPVQPQCNMTRAELQDLLKESDFGSHKPMFDAYFRHDANNVPVCVHCSQPIALHGAGAPTTVPVAVSEPAVEPRLQPPRDFVQDPTNAAKWERRDTNSALVVTFGVLFGLATIMFIAFGVSGLLRRAGVIAVAPSMLMFVSLFLLALASWSSTTIDLEARVLSDRSGRWMFPCGCCDSEVTASLSNVEEVRSETLYGQNHKAVRCDISLRLRNGTSILVHSVPVRDGEAVTAEWKGFILAYGGQR